MVNTPQILNTDIWKCILVGNFPKMGLGLELYSYDKKNITQSFKLDFKVTNNVAEYEVIDLGLELAKSLKVECLVVYGDSEMIIKQIRNLCQTKHLRIRAYRNEVWYFANNYSQAFNTTSISNTKSC